MKFHLEEDPAYVIFYYVSTQENSIRVETLAAFCNTVICSVKQLWDFLFNMYCLSAMILVF